MNETGIALSSRILKLLSGILALAFVGHSLNMLQATYVQQKLPEPSASSSLAGQYNGWRIALGLAVINLCLHVGRGWLGWTPLRQVGRRR